MQGELKMTQTSQSPAGIVVRAATCGVRRGRRGGLSPSYRPDANAEVVGKVRRSACSSPATWTSTPAAASTCSMSRSEKGNEDVISGSYLEVVPPSKLAFTWSSEKSERWYQLILADNRSLRIPRTAPPAAAYHEGLPSPHRRPCTAPVGTNTIAGHELRHHVATMTNRRPKAPRRQTPDASRSGQASAGTGRMRPRRRVHPPSSPSEQMLAEACHATLVDGTSELKRVAD